MNEILFVLGVPCSADWCWVLRRASGCRALNTVFSLFTFIAGVLLALRVVGEGRFSPSVKCFSSTRSTCSWWR